MSIKETALAAMVTYYDAHEACNKAATPEAQKAKREAHGKWIEAAKLYRPQHRPKQER